MRGTPLFLNPFVIQWCVAQDVLISFIIHSSHFTEERNATY